MMETFRVGSISFLVSLFACMGMLNGCRNDVQLNVVVYDACNQFVLNSAKHIGVSLRSASGSSQSSSSATWDAADGDGSFDGIDPVNDAIVTVLVRNAGNSGGPGDQIGATSVGLFDLLGEDPGGVVDLTVAVGKIGTFANTTDLSNPAQCSALKAPRVGHTATRLGDGRVFIAGGYRINPMGDGGVRTRRYWNTTEIYSPKTGVFTLGADMAWKRRSHTATLLSDGRVLISGGVGLVDDDNDPATLPVERVMKTALLFDPNGNSFKSITMVEQRTGHTATLLGDGSVMLAGGAGDDDQAVGNSEIFDPISGVFTLGAQLLTARAHHAAVRIGSSTVALIGGRSTGIGGGSGVVIDSVEFLTTTQGSFAGPRLSVGRSHLAAALLPRDDAIVVVGGFASAVTDLRFGVGSRAIDVIQLNTQELSMSTAECSQVQLLQGRGAPALVEIKGEILVLGGMGVQSVGVEGIEVLGSAEILRFGAVKDCSIFIDATKNNMSSPRAGAVVTPLYGGDILFTGGMGWSESLQQHVSVSQGEIYIPER